MSELIGLLGLVELEMIEAPIEMAELTADVLEFAAVPLSRHQSCTQLYQLFQCRQQVL